MMSVLMIRLLLGQPFHVGQSKCGLVHYAHVGLHRAAQRCHDLHGRPVSANGACGYGGLSSRVACFDQTDAWLKQKSTCPLGADWQHGAAQRCHVLQGRP